MHPDFPLDPITIGIGVLALLAAVFGFLGGDPPWLFGIVLLFVVGVPLLLLEWLGFFIYERFIEPRRDQPS